MEQLTISDSIPCPWCKCADTRERAVGIDVRSETSMMGCWHVACSCGASGPHADGSTAAILAWNRIGLPIGRPARTLAGAIEESALEQAAIDLEFCNLFVTLDLVRIWLRRGWTIAPMEDAIVDVVESARVVHSRMTKTPARPDAPRAAEKIGVEQREGDKPQ